MTTQRQTLRTRQLGAGASIRAAPDRQRVMEVLRSVEEDGAIGGWRLDGTTMVVTLEPCAMCAGALVNARVRRLIFGAWDPKAGFCGSLGNLVQDPRLNRRLEVTGGFEEQRSRALLQRFFQQLRGGTTDTERWQSG